MAGATEQQLHADGIACLAGRARYDASPRGRLSGDSTGFLKLLFRPDDMRLLGVHVIGEQATELVHIGLMAMLAGEGADLFNRACFNYPTLGDLYKYATYDALLARAGRRPSA
jgi:NAD(P) transhydrogenase